MIDVVLGVAEAPVSVEANNAVSFTVDFPAGAVITYVGSFVDPSETDASLALNGTWTQHRSGIFGADTGSWEATSDPQ